VLPLFSGRILLRDAVVDGWLHAEAGRIVDWGEGAPEQKVHATGWIVPAPVNAHTHIADTFLRGVPGKPRTVAELVGPGGWKQRHLAAATAEHTRSGIQVCIEEMAAVGTAAFLDFREGGAAGARLLRDAAADLPVEARIYGRPLHNIFDAAEAAEVLAVSDGIGLSAMRDFENTRDVEAWSEAAHRARKPFALHASEGRRESMDAVLALAPSFVVHATQATPGDLRRLADDEVPVVVCPRSNAYYGLRTPVAAMAEAGLKVAVGTDNGMLQDGNVLAELAQLHAWAPTIPSEAFLRMATWHGRDVAGLSTTSPRRGDVADWIVLPERPWGLVADGRPGFVVEGP